MSEKTVTTSEFCSLVFISTIAVKMFMLPALLLKDCERDSVFVMLFYLTAEFINILLLVMLSYRNPDKTVYEILSETLGKVGGKIVIAYFSVFLFIKAVLILSEIKIFFSAGVYDRISWRIMSLPLLILCALFATKSLKVIARTSILLVPFIFVSAIILSLLLIGKIPLENIFPFFERGAKDFTLGIQKYPLWFGDVSILSVCLGQIKQSSHFRLSVLLTRAVSSVMILFFSVIMVATYCNLASQISYGQNISSMTQYTVGSNDYGRYDYIIYCIWLFAVFIKLILIFFALTRNAEYVFGKQKRNIFAFSIALIAFIVAGFILKDEQSVLLLCTSELKYVLIVPEFVLPSALYIFALIKYEKAKDTTYAIS